MLILINGAKRAGKDEFAKILTKLLQGTDSAQRSFAAPMKDILAQTLGVSLEVLDDLKNNEDYKIQFMDSKDSIITTEHTVRKALQIFGTDAIKPYFGVTVWGDLMLKDYRTFNNCTFIVPDFRYPDELKPLLDVGAEIVTIYIQRDLVENSGDTHSSETSLQGFEFDYYVSNNQTLEDLEEKAKMVLKSILTKG